MRFALAWIGRGFAFGSSALVAWYLGATLAQHFGAVYPTWPR
jgi:hypothetical protein